MLEGSEFLKKYPENSIGYLLFKGSNMLDVANIEDPKGESRIFLGLLLNIDNAEMYANLERTVDEFTIRKYMTWVKKRCTHYPLQYIVGYTFFYDYDFNCREKVLIPRFDTEHMVSLALEMGPDRDCRILDMCTGTGCVGISVYLERLRDGYQDDVTLTDISDDALLLATENAAHLDAEVRVLKSDLFEAFTDEEGNATEKFDIFLCNPPYIRSAEINFLMKDVREYEPRLALDGDRDGLRFYKEIIPKLKNYLTENGIVIFEIGSNQYEDVAKLLRGAGFREIHKYTDFSQLDRTVTAIV